ncbi:hypothetical protein E2C01_022360 [Portunus trituberculatus]|uniref:Uncharacterized protein n=1 Tax=Portunus trituberculatus TaxID=210409 RepID=A0A5B7E556_PORTR|nr:hypothetical protein [Portunus trituberculatus]
MGPETPTKQSHNTARVEEWLREGEAPGHRENDSSRGSSGVTETQDSDTSELNRPVLTNATLAPSLLAAAVALTLTPKLKKYC